MPVRDLAPALLALGELFADASRTVYPEQEPVALDIKATEEGSFILHLILEAERAWDQVEDLFGSDAASALVNIKELVIGAPLGLFALIRHLKGRRIKSRENGPDPGQIKLTLTDGTTIEIPVEVLKLYDNPSVRRKARDVVTPLGREGVERLDFDSEDLDTVSLDEADLSAFESPEVEDILGENEVDLTLSIIAPTFREGYKWQFDAGQGRFWATIEDPDFLARVDSGERFAKGDRLRCRLLLVQLQVEGKLTTQSTVVKVYEHIPREDQLRLENGAL
jgi:hypothetical protein